MKIEGRQSIRARRTSKNSPPYDSTNSDSTLEYSLSLEGMGNGLHRLNSTSDPNVDTSANAMIQMAAGAVNDLENSLGKAGLNLLTASPTTSGNDQEISSLKDLLIMNLDLIQHQQQLLISQDKQIKQLTTEKEALMSRLDRMDRRFSLLKQKDDDSTTAGDTSASIQKTPKRKAESKTDTPRRRGRQSATVSTTPSNNLAPDKPEPSHSLRSHSSPSESESKIPHISPPIVPIKTLKHCPQGEDKTDLIRTDALYFVPHEEFTDPDIVGKIIQSPKRKKIRVEVPKWRFHPVSNYYQMEGTEITDDEIYLKRHLKFENDEKRRKRWDMQRLREQRAYEKLVSGRTGIRTDPKPVEREPVTSLEPDTTKLKYIDIRDTLPVSAFGFPLSAVEPSEFTLTWPQKQTTETKSADATGKVKKR